MNRTPTGLPILVVLARESPVEAGQGGQVPLEFDCIHPSGVPEPSDLHNRSRNQADDEAIFRFQQLDLRQKRVFFEKGPSPNAISLEVFRNRPSRLMVVEVDRKRALAFARGLPSQLSAVRCGEPIPGGLIFGNVSCPLARPRREGVSGWSPAVLTAARWLRLVLRCRSCSYSRMK
jgi:hypothetical protein